MDQHVKITQRDIIETEDFVFDSKRHLLIGDPDYLEDIDRLSKKGLNNLTAQEKNNLQNLVELTCDRNLLEYKSGAIKIDHIKEKVSYDYYWGKGELDNGYYEVNILFGEAIDKSYSLDDKNKLVGDLACDCCRFDIYCDGNSKEFNTCSDGMYGYFIEDSTPGNRFSNGLKIVINFDDELFSKDDIKQSFTYLFGAKQKIQNKGGKDR